MVIVVNTSDTSCFSPSWSWSYSSSYCVTLVFTTITILHTSVRRGRDRIVVLIVLHLYSLLLPCFILHNKNYYTIMTTTDWSMKYGNSSEYKCNTIRTTMRSRRTEVWSMVIVVNTSVTQVLIVLHLYSLLLPYFILQSVVVDHDHDGLKYEAC
jgi:hypothetical protein